MVISTSEWPLPADTGVRLTGFTELVATALADTEAQAALTASRARIVAAADTTRRRIERDLHDGAQQRLVSPALHLRTMQTAMPSQADGLQAQLDRVVAELTAVHDDLRSIARRLPQPSSPTADYARQRRGRRRRRCFAVGGGEVGDVGSLRRSRKRLRHPVFGLGWVRAR